LPISPVFHGFWGPPFFVNGLSGDPALHTGPPARHPSSHLAGPCTRRTGGRRAWRGPRRRWGWRGQTGAAPYMVCFHLSPVTCPCHLSRVTPLSSLNSLKSNNRQTDRQPVHIAEVSQ
jgi:hypothetical protein